jgi:hypothetical protein
MKGMRQIKTHFICLARQIVHKHPSERELSDRAYTSQGTIRNMSETVKETYPCRIVGISGSIRPGSYATLAVALALTGAEELKCETKLINLRDYQLVFCDGKDDESHFPQDVSACAKRSSTPRESFWARRSIMADTAES